MGMIQNGLRKGSVICLILCLLFSEILRGNEESLFKEQKVDAATSEQTNEEEGTTRTYINENINAHNYTYPVHADIINSYLEPQDNGYMRVQKYNTADILIEYYSDSFGYISNRTIKAELPIFGGFYAGEDAYYMVWGKDNIKQHDDSEVIRVVKYDKDWNRLSACSMYGANTSTIFTFGPVRMTECNGFLFVRATHEGYSTGEDELVHQSNMVLQIREADMVLTDFSDGEVSHCLNTFLLRDDTNHILTLDQSDGSPERGAVIARYKGVPGEYCIKSDYTALLTFSYKGKFGQNTTRSTLGGFAYSDTSILVAGTSVDQDKSTPMGTSQNLYVSVTDRKELEEENGNFMDLKSNTTTVRWFTDFKEKDNKSDFHHSATTPRLVKWNNNLFLLIWSETEYDGPTGKLYYQFLDGKGNPIGKKYSKKGDISDCEPVIKNNKAIWYTTNNKKLCFYAIDTEGNLEKKTVSFPKTMDIFPKAMQECKMAITRIGALKRSQVDSSYVLTFRGKVLKEHKDYIVIGKGLCTDTDSVRYFSRTVISCSGDFYGDHTFQSEPIRNNPIMEKITASANGVTLKWEQESGCMGYVIYRSTDGKDKKKVADIMDFVVCSWKDKDVKKGHYYTYSMKAYTKKGTKILYTNSTDPITILKGNAKALAKPKIKSVKWNVQTNKMTIKFAKVNGVDGYECQFSDNQFLNIYHKKYTKSRNVTVKLNRFCSWVRVRGYRLKNGKKLYGVWSEPYDYYTSSFR